ncbi:MAG: FHA domain-containing protein [Gammaproteobacteria bacterium]|nr:FHA domain-containing protein [Gammaproteobacteria bacterium]
MERLPENEPVRVDFGPRQSPVLRLANHDFTLVSGSHNFLLIDDTGGDIRLPGNHAVVGRASSCGAVLSARYRSVSRKHLMIEIHDDGTVYLTDISLMGTYIPGEAVG